MTPISRPKRTYFGTDGIRGQANRFPMTAEVALRVGLAAGRAFSSGDERRHLVVIGKDTRLSGYMVEPALVAGFVSAGMDVRTFGPLPTPAVAMMTRSMRADLGVMISASHNPAIDNGIKLFGPDGYKLSDEREAEIAAMMDQGLEEELAAPTDLGRVLRIDDAQARYVEIAKATFPKTLSLSGLRIVVDCANGAGYKVAPTALYELGAEVIPIGVNPTGLNINEGCGSTHPDAMGRAVREFRADVGLALDGDADRIALCDEHGTLIDGDQIVAIIAGAWHAEGKLTGGGVVGTVMSNLGLERMLADKGLALHRTKVGDRHVMAKMREGGLNLGGEQSGHIILSDLSTTGDGLISALQVLAVLAQAHKNGSPVKMSALARQFEPAPQKLVNVRYAAGSDPLSSDLVQSAIKEGEARLNGSGRVLVRASGTEALIRVMAEGDDERLVAKVVQSIAQAVKQAAA